MPVPPARPKAIIPCRKCQGPASKTVDGWVSCVGSSGTNLFCSRECYFTIVRHHDPAPCCGECHICGATMEKCAQMKMPGHNSPKE